MTADDALREEARRRADYLDAPPMYPEGYEHGFIEGARWSRQQVARVEQEAYQRGQTDAADRLKRIADLEPDQATFKALAVDNGIDYADGYLDACIVARDIAQGNH